MIFAHPQFLWLLLLAPILALVTYVMMRRRATTSRRLLVATIRLLCIAAVVLAIARPLVGWRRGGTTTVAVVDVSPSIADADLRRIASELNSRRNRLPSSDDLRIIAFASRSMVVPDFGDLAALRRAAAEPLFANDPRDGASALADALRLAGAVIPNDRKAEVLLYTDGLQTRGDAAAETRRLAERGIAVQTTALQPAPAQLCLIEELVAPAAASAGQSIAVDAMVRANRQASAKLEIQVDGEPVASTGEIAIRPGTQTLSVSVPLRRAGLTRLDARLISGSQTIDARSAAVAVAPPANVLVIDASGDGRTAAALTKLLGDSAAVATAAPTELTNPERLANLDLLVLANVPAEQVTEAAQQNVMSAVGNGLGLLVTGGAPSFGPGGWSESPLAEVLPVKMPQEIERQDPSATAVFIIDTSGSMTGPRISVAKEVVRLALRRLQPQDKAGIVEFYGSKRWAAPIQSAANHLDLNRALNRLTAGGGTVILPAIEEAEFALKNVNTRTRHVVILTDAGVESGPYEMLARRMADEGMTVSTVLCGPEQHSAFLASIAQWGRGRFYHAPDRFALPEVILHQPQTQSPPPVSLTPSPLATRDADDVTRGVDFTAAPPLGGYVRTQPKPTADVLVQTPGGYPVIARWRYGRGRAAAMTTDFGSTWTRELAQWSGSGVLASNLCRSLYAAPASERLALRPILRPAGLEVQADALRGGELQSSAIALELAAPAGAVARKMTVDPIRPGSWNALFRDLPPGEYELRAKAADGSVAGRAGVALPMPREIASDRADEALLRQISDLSRAGKSTAAAGAIRWIELWPALVLLSLVMLLLNVFVRRYPLRGARVITASRSTAVAAALLALLAVLPSRASAQSTQPVNEALESGDLPVAVVELNQLLQQHPSDPALLRQLAFVKEMNGDDAGAAVAFEKAIAAQLDPAVRAKLRLHLAILLFDKGDSDRATALLTQPGPTTRRSEALIAAIYGQPALAAKLAQDKDLLALLVRGQALLDSGDPAGASEAFSAAIPLATQARDRRFIIDRIIASARQAGKLPQLADAWMAEPNLPPDRLLPLVGVLRELSRPDDILALWKRKPSDPAAAELLTSQRFVGELLAAMREAKRLADAEAVCRAALEAEPKNDQWLNTLARILVEQDRTADADALYRQAAARADSSAGILRVAQSAKSQGRDEVAIEVAARAAKFGPTAEVGALLFEAEVESHRGNRPKSIAAMNKAAGLAGDDAKLLAAVAEAFESSGNTARAVELYRRASGGGEDVLQRLAWLLERDNKLVESRDLWYKLWRTAGSPPRRREAQNRLLDLSSRTGTIADLATELEDRLAAGTASGEDLNLLIDIYVGAQDPAAAAEIVASAKNVAGSERDRLDQLAKLYLKCGRFGQADRTLRQLLAADPEDAIQTLQEIAVLAIERARPADAEAALKEIAKQTGSDDSTAELRAGVYEQLGLFAEAAKEYRRALVANPDQVEDWVLWAGAMNEANMKAQAVNRLLVLAESADGDDLFAVAVDGLLNLEAPREALRVARRYAIERLAADGRKLVHYQLIRDISETIGDLPGALRAGELSLLVAGEQRTEYIRELITLCKMSGQGRRGLELGRTLLSLGDQVPPQVFLEIGRQLLDEGRLTEADRAFARAEEVSGDSEIRRQVARMYESAGQVRMALNTLHPLIRLHPNEVELRARSGGMHEQLGEHDDAFDHYLEALTLMLRRGDSGGAAASTMPTSGRSPRVPRQGASMTEADQFLDGLVQGLLICARTEATQKKLIDAVHSAAEAELTASPAGKRVPSIVAERAALLRRFAFALHQPDVADAFDQRVAHRWAEDASFTATALDSRMDWGLLERAAKLAAATNQPLPRQLELRRALLSTTQPAASIAADFAAQLIPQLLLNGQVDRARQVLAACEKRLPRNKETLPILIASALAVDDPSAAEAWCNIWLARAEMRKSGKPDAADVSECVRTAWPALSATARRTLLNRVTVMVERAEAPDRAALAMLALRVSVALGEDAATRLPLAKAAVVETPANGTALAELLLALPESERPAIFSAIVESAQPNRVRALVFSLLGSTDVTIEGPLLETMMQAFAAAPPAAAADRREMLVGGAWARNVNQKPALRRLATVLSKDAAADAGARMAVAQALATCGDQPAADKLALSAIEGLLKGPAKGRFDSRTLGEAVAILSPGAARQLLDSASTRPAATQPTAGTHLLRAILLDEIGDRPGATEAYRQAFLAMPSDMEVRRVFTDRLEQDVRWADVVDAFKPFAHDDSVVNLPQRFRLMKSFRQLGRWDEAQAMYREDGPLRALQRLQMAAEAGKLDGLLPVFRSFHVDNRWERRSFTPFMQPLVGAAGMREFIEKHGDFISSRRSIYRIAAELSWGPDELQALYRAATPDASEIPSLSTALAASFAGDEALGRLTAEMQQRAAAASLTTKDRALLVALLQEGRRIPETLAPAINESMLLLNPSEQPSLRSWADSWRAAGDTARADAIDRWNAVAVIVIGHNARSGLSSSAPPASAYDRRLLEAAAPAPGDNLEDSSEADRLVRLASIESAQAERSLEQLRAAGRISDASDPQLAGLRARFAGGRGDLAEFAARAVRAIDVAPFRYGVRTVDVRQLLPEKIATDQGAALVQSLVKVIEDRAAQRPRERAGMCRALCLAGSWAAEHSLASEAQACLAAALRLGADPGEHRLWIADLARLIGQEALADQIELELFKSRSLPPPRIAPLLERIEKAEGKPAAETLARQAAAYCGFPAITSRASTQPAS